MNKPIQFPKATELAHQLVGAHLKKRHCVIDATAGNGHDTLFLAEMVGNGGKVYAIDNQQAAIDSTRQRLGDSPFAQPVEYFCASHADLLELVPTKKHGRVRAVMFNLGYLPGGNKSETTTWPTTLKAIRAALQILNADGIITIAIYPGHPAGKQESIALDKFVAQLDPTQFRAIRYGVVNAANDPPYLLAIEKN
ncbi:MAG: SAM-dependent methyltransferase [Verrucomicrobiales bacterium]